MYHEAQMMFTVLCFNLAPWFVPSRISLAGLGCRFALTVRVSSLAVTQDGPLLRPRARLDDKRVMVRREVSAIANGTAGLDWTGLGRTILLNCLKRLL